MMTGFSRRSRARQADGNGWREVLRICSERAGIQDFRFHDLRHTFASWYMMNGGDLYELAKILGHSNIRMTERYAKLGKTHIAKTGKTANALWSLMAGASGERAASAV